MEIIEINYPKSGKRWPISEAIIPECDSLITFSGKQLKLYPNEPLTEKPKPVYYDEIIEREKQEDRERMLGYERTRKRIDLFLANAIKIWDKRDLILNDSRLFLVPFTVHSIAYYVAENNATATLGALVEWWEAFPKARIMKDDELYGLVTDFVIWCDIPEKSTCLFVNRDGEKGAVIYPHYDDIWQSYCSIINRYSYCLEHYQHYTMEEAVRILGE